MTGELVDIVDDDDRIVTTVSRAEMRARRLQHRSVGIGVISSDGLLLIHRRSELKDIWPGWWDIAAGGVVGSGETYLDAACRELGEELGVVVGPEDLLPLGSGRYVDDHVAEICHQFLVVHDGPFHFADGEVTATRWVTGAELDVLLRNERFLPDSVAVLLPLLRPHFR